MDTRLITFIRQALEEARRAKTEAGPGEKGRNLALTVTALEDALLRAKCSDSLTLLG